LGKKIVRTSGLQIATSPSLEMLDDYHKERWSGRSDFTDKIDRDKTIKLSDVD
jgi:hypothetical protein